MGSALISDSGLSEPSPLLRRISFPRFFLAAWKSSSEWRGSIGIPKLSFGAADIVWTCMTSTPVFLLLDLEEAAEEGLTSSSLERRQGVDMVRRTGLRREIKWVVMVGWRKVKV